MGISHNPQELAARFDKIRFCGDAIERAVRTRRTREQYAPAVRTLEGTMRIATGDWIIRGVKGELYPCKPDIFEATYDAVIDDEPGTEPRPLRPDDSG